MVCSDQIPMNTWIVMMHANILCLQFVKLSSAMRTPWPLIHTRVMPYNGVLYLLFAQHYMQTLLFYWNEININIAIRFMRMRRLLQFISGLNYIVARLSSIRKIGYHGWSTFPCMQYIYSYVLNHSARNNANTNFQRHSIYSNRAIWPVLLDWPPKLQLYIIGSNLEEPVWTT